MSVKAEAVKVTDVCEIDVDVLFSILGVLTASLVDNDLADERSKDLGCELLDIRILSNYFKEAFHIGGRCLEVFYNNCNSINYKSYNAVRIKCEYAELILNGDPETYLKTVTEYKPLD